MLAAKNIVIELLSAVIWGTAIGLLMAITANSFVYLVVIATEYRTSFTFIRIPFPRPNLLTLQYLFVVNSSSFN